MVAPSPHLWSGGGKSGHRRTGCLLMRGDLPWRIMESATENRPLHF
ncbi:uncharacterized protein METZ01_LOCUS90687 [marine metagenome]|uniref:Uncharacterized protein n=1 Tax=marine metagenome TaxID=408172 RepID=A0A381VEL0_9ZZZZ